MTLQTEAEGSSRGDSYTIGIMLAVLGMEEVCAGIFF